MLLPSPAIEARPEAATKTPAIARFLPSLTDLALLMPVIFLFAKLGGARTLLGDGDTGWHVRTGEWILAHRAVPTVDFFSFSRPGAPWFAWEWLWDVGFALLHQRWGMAGVVAASMAVICLTSALLFRLVRRTCGNGLVAIAVTLLATGGCAIHWLARPHLFTLLFFTITLHITSRASEGRTGLLTWLVPLTLLWTNVHGGFFVIFLVLGCYIAGYVANAIFAVTRTARRESLKASRPWLLIFGLCFAATFVNPYGWQLHRHVIEYITDPYQLQHITEFQSMNFHSPVTVYFEPLMILTIAVAIWDLRNRRFADAFLTLGWLHLALIAQRNLPIYSIAACPAAARGIMATIAHVRKSSPDIASWVSKVALWFEQFSESFEETDRIPRVHLASILPVVAVSTLLVLTPPAKGVLNSKLTSTYDPAAYPEKALPLLLSSETHHIFAEDEWGDYLIYNLYPAKKVFVDGRSDFYGDDFGNRYLDLMNVQPGWQKTLDKYSIDTIVIAPRFALATTLKISRDWKVVYDDHVALIFRRSVPGPASLVTSNAGDHRDHAIAKTTTKGRKAAQPNT